MTPRRPAARPWPLLAAMWDQKQKVERKNGPAGMMATRLHPKPSLGVEKYTWQGSAYLVLVHARVPSPLAAWFGDKLQNLLQQFFHPVSISSSVDHLSGSPLSANSWSALPVTTYSLALDARDWSHAA